MASYFWVGGTGNWDGTTNHFATTTGGTATVAAPISTDTVTFDTNSGTAATVTITTNVSITSITVNKSDLTLTTNGTATINTSGNMTLTTGVLNTNGSACSWAAFSSSTTTARTLTLGASLITLTATTTTSFNVSNNTAFTLNAGSSTITLSGTSVVLNCGNGGGFAAKTFNNVVFSGSGSPNLSGVSGTVYNNVTRTGTAVTTDAFIIQNNQTINGTLTLTGNSLTNRLLMQSATVGTAVTLALGTTGTASSTNVDFMDVTVTGTHTPLTGTSLGDCLGNSGITFDTPVQQTWSGNTTGNWSTAANWTSRVPLPQDNVLINGLTSGTVTADMPRMGANITFTGSTGGTFTPTAGPTFYGNWTHAANVTYTLTNSITGSGRGAQTIDTVGVSFYMFIVTAPSGTYSLAGNMVTTRATTLPSLTLTNGTFDANGKNVTASQVSAAAGVTINMGAASVWKLTGTGAVWSITGTTTINANTSTISISDVGTLTKTFAGNGKTYHNLSISGSGSGAVTFTGANTFTNLPQVTGGTKSIVWPGSTTTTFTNGGNFGNSSNVITMTASAGSASLSFGSQVNANFLSLTNIPAAGTTPAYAGTNSTDGGGNTNWVFTAAPLTTPLGGTLLLMGAG